MQQLDAVLKHVCVFLIRSLMRSNAPLADQQKPLVIQLQVEASYGRVK